jgi:hypothetical protein
MGLKPVLANPTRPEKALPRKQVLKPSGRRKTDKATKIACGQDTRLK